jgi:recombination protein RecA
MEDKTRSALDEALKKIQKSIPKKDLIFRMGEDSGINRDIKFFPTGIFQLDEVLGGGFPRGRIVELYGPESSGKSALAQYVLGRAQVQGEVCAFIDAEHSFDPVFAKKVLGFDAEYAFLSQPDYGEDGLSAAELLIQNGAKFIVVDSVAALVPRAEMEGDFGDAQMGLHARLMSKSMRKLNGMVYKNGVILIFINQIREKIGVVFGNPETTTGGRALKFWSSIRLEIRRMSDLKDGEKKVGLKQKIKIIKNKVGVPFRQTELEFYFDRGFDNSFMVIRQAIDAGLVSKSGAWYSINIGGKNFKENEKAQGVDGFVDMLGIKGINELESMLLGGKTKESDVEKIFRESEENAIEKSPFDN